VSLAFKEEVGTRLVNIQMVFEYTGLDEITLEEGIN
jgi:hypothetical protein